MRTWVAEKLFSNATPIITCCLATPKDLAVDWLGSNLYWTDSERGVIEVRPANWGHVPNTVYVQTLEIGISHLYLGYLLELERVASFAV